MHGACRRVVLSAQRGASGRRWLRTLDMSVDMTQYARKDRYVPYQVSMGSYNRTVRSRLLQLKYWVVPALVGVVWMSSEAMRYRIPFTGRMGGLRLPYGLDVTLGGAMLENEISDENILPTDHQYSRWVKRILERVLLAIDKEKHTVPGLAECLEWDWRFTVIQNDTPNAFCFPGGNVCVHSGLIQAMGTEEKMALLVAHEIGHALAHHGTEKMALKWGLQVLGGVLFPDSPPLRGTKTAMQLSYSRSKELEADEIGLHLCLAAGYDISPSLIQSAHDTITPTETPPSLFNTHPTKAERVSRLTSLLEEVEPRYRASSKKQPSDTRIAFGEGWSWYPWVELSRQKRAA